MQMRNETKNVILSEDVLILKTLMKKAKGLIDINEAKAAFFKTRWGIHTFGMKWPLDCLILDNLGNVKRIKKNLVPNRIFFWLPIWNGVVELPAGKITETKTEIGDKISII